MGSYFNDVLGGCLILAITNILLALAKFRPLKALLPCLGMCLACGLFWEYITPLYLPSSVSDVWDIAAYMSGGVIWWLVCLFGFERRTEARSRRSRRAG